MSHLADQIYAVSKTSKAGADLWELFNVLADDVDGAELLGRFDAYVDNLDSEAQALYRELKGA
jgi:hypothetical protein